MREFWQPSRLAVGGKSGANGVVCAQEVFRLSGNWRITFEFTDGNVYIVNYEDYH